MIFFMLWVSVSFIVGVTTRLSYKYWELFLMLSTIQPSFIWDWDCWGSITYQLFQLHGKMYFPNKDFRILNPVWIIVCHRALTPNIKYIKMGSPLTAQYHRVPFWIFFLIPTKIKNVSSSSWVCIDELQLPPLSTNSANPVLLHHQQKGRFGKCIRNYCSYIIIIYSHTSSSHSFMWLASWSCN